MCPFCGCIAWQNLPVSTGGGCNARCMKCRNDYIVFEREDTSMDARKFEAWSVGGFHTATELIEGRACGS